MILTNKPDWVVYPEEIAKRLNISKRSVDKHFKILEDSGYMCKFTYVLGGREGKLVRRFFSDLPFNQEHISYLKKQLEEELFGGEFAGAK
nr:HTH domain-containing protein [Streptococcus moroccensis]